MSHLLLRVLFVGCLGWFGGVLRGGQPETIGSPGFSFTGPEIFPVDHQIGGLRAADFNGDGLTDLLVVNNLRSHLTLLENRGRRKPDPRRNTTGTRREINELPPDARFEIRSIPSERRIAAMEVADFNGDGRPDIAAYGEPRQLAVWYNQGKDGWGRPEVWPLEDGRQSPNSLLAGDLNHDGRADLVLLGESFFFLWPQRETGGFEEPRRIPFSGEAKAAQILDLNGDRRNDLLLVDWDHTHPARIRLQDEDGALGPELQLPFPALRAFWADDLEGDGVTELITITKQSGRAQVSTLSAKAGVDDGEEGEGLLQVLPLLKTTKARRGLQWADLNGDGRTDLLVAETETSQLRLFTQTAPGRFDGGRLFPSLAGISKLEVLDWNGDGRGEIFVFSPDERQIAVCVMEERGRISFPRPVGFSGKPLVMAAGRLRPELPPVVAAIMDRDGKRFVEIRGAAGQTRSQPLAESFRANPVDLFVHDVNQDGLGDLVVLTPYENLKLLVCRADGTLDEADLAPPGGTIEDPLYGVADVDGDGKPELMLPQKNFVRAVVLEAGTNGGAARPAWSFRVKDQINGASGNSRIAGVIRLPGRAADAGQLLLLDAGRKFLSLCRQDQDGVWQIARNIALAQTDYQSLAPVQFGGTNHPPSLGFGGLNSAAWWTTGRTPWRIHELADYETPVQNGRLTDVVTGDLNGDGRRDLVFIETARQHLDIVGFGPSGKLVPGSRWQVFEERSYRGGGRAGAPEPREVLVAEVTGDGKPDLIVLVHDRILLYPQQ